MRHHVIYIYIGVGFTKIPTLCAENNNLNVPNMHKLYTIIKKCSNIEQIQGFATIYQMLPKIYLCYSPIVLTAFDILL